MSEELPFYAHSLPGEPLEKWQKLREHLRDTAKLAQKFAESFGAGEWHDTGNFSSNHYLRSSYAG